MSKRFEKWMQGSCGYCGKEKTCDHQQYNYGPGICGTWEPHRALTHVPTKKVTVDVFDWDCK